MEKILLNDLLKVPQEDLITWKIKFNQYNGYSNPLELYKSNSEHVNTRWLLWRENRRYYRVSEVVIGLLKMSYDKWLLTSIKRITKDLNVKKDIGFEAEELKEYEPLYGRVILKFHKKTRTQIFKAQNLMNELEVLEILPSIYDGDEFPGYDKVCLSYLQLKNIIQRGRENSWKAALENQKAVYLIY